MEFVSLTLFAIYYICTYTSIEIKLELKKNILKFGYGINFKYEDMLAHSFNTFYVVTKFILLSIKDFKFLKLNYYNTCAYLDEKNNHNAETKKCMLDLLAFCKKIERYVHYYRKQTESVNNTAHLILKNGIDLILPQLLTKHKHGIIMTLVSSFIGLAYKGISSFLHNRRHKELHKAVKAMDSKTAIHHNKLMHFEDSMVMYGIYNAEIPKQLINTVHCIQNTTSSNEKLFAGQWSTATLQSLYSNVQGIKHYSVNSLLYLRTIQDTYVLLYKELITQLHIYATAIRIMAKGYLPISLITPLKLKEILNEVRNTVKKINPDYDLVIKRLHLYYHMKLVTLALIIIKIW